MDVIVHQAEADYDNGVVLSKPAQTQGDAVHTRNEFFDRSEQDVLLQPLRGEMIIMLAFHNSRFSKLNRTAPRKKYFRHIYMFLYVERCFIINKRLSPRPEGEGITGDPW